MKEGVPKRVPIPAQELHIGIVASRFHGEVVDRLLEGARSALRGNGLEASRIGIERVPGAWEIPFALDEMTRSGRWHGLIALGVLVRGETSHFEIIARVTAEGIAEVSRRRELPISFGVLTCDTIEQALARAGGAIGNLGEEAALATLEMATLAKRLRGAGSG